MKIGELLQCIKFKELIGGEDVEITGLCADSQKVSNGDLFFCYKGNEFDSHGFASEAVACGAAAIVCERKLDCSVPQIIVPDGRRAIAPAARAFFGYADKKLKLVGITGTNGKTTTTYILKSIFDEAGKKAGIIGTLGISYADKFISPELTTPDPIYLHSVFADMVNCGVEYVFMEVSAHAIHFEKTEGLEFAVGIFTNCTQDHLDFFGNMRDYAECKKSFFNEKICRYAVVNSDDAVGRQIISSNKNAVSYGLKNPADVFAVDIQENIKGTSFVINLFDELYEMNLKLAALHNVYNAMGAAACARILGVETAYIADGLAKLQSVTGRLELVAKFNGADIFVDFAHTPDGLEKSLQALKKLCGGISGAVLFQREEFRVLFFTIIVLGVAAALFSNFADLFRDHQVSDLAFYFVYLLLIAVLLKFFAETAGAVKEILNGVLTFVRLYIPTYMLAVGSASGAASATVYYQLLLVAVSLIEWGYLSVLVPSVYVYVLLTVINGIWMEEKLALLLELLE